MTNDSALLAKGQLLNCRAFNLVTSDLAVDFTCIQTKKDAFWRPFLHFKAGVGLASATSGGYRAVPASMRCEFSSRYRLISRTISLFEHIFRTAVLKCSEDSNKQLASSKH